MTQYSDNGLLCFGLVFTKMTEQRQKTVYPTKLHSFHGSAGLATTPSQSAVSNLLCFDLVLPSQKLKFGLVFWLRFGSHCVGSATSDRHEYFCMLPKAVVRSFSHLRPFERYTVKLSIFCKSKISAAAIFKMTKKAISQQRFDRSSRNLAQWCKMGHLTARPLKVFNLRKSYLLTADRRNLENWKSVSKFSRITEWNTTQFGKTANINILLKTAVYL